MKAPDKIYLREFKEGGLSQVWSGIKPTQETIIASPEYIRKDALLEWIDEYKNYSAGPSWDLLKTHLETL